MWENVRVVFPGERGASELDEGCEKMLCVKTCSVEKERWMCEGSVGCDGDGGAGGRAATTRGGVSVCGVAVPVAPLPPRCRSLVSP